MKTSLLALSAAAFVAIAATALASTPSAAEPVYPWCAASPAGQSGIPSCSYATLSQCQAFIAGLSGSCEPNARASIAAQAQMPRRNVR